MQTKTTKKRAPKKAATTSTKTKSSRVFDSMQAAASALGTDKDTLAAAKAAGCPAFRGSRVHEAELQAWLRTWTPPDGSTLPLKDQKLNEEIRKLRNKNDKDEKLVVSKDKGKAAIQACITRIRAFLEAKLENEYPSAVAGMDVPQARVYGRRVHDQILEEFQNLASEWAKI